MAIDLSLLRQEIENDPINLGYSSFLAIRNDFTITSMLNEVRQDSDHVVSRGRISKDLFLDITAPIVFRIMQLAHLGDSQASFWLSVFDRLVANSDNINTEDPNFITLLDQMMDDSVLTQQDKDLIITRQGARSEKLFGSFVKVDEVSESLNEGGV
jgi:hypothetical protein